MHSLIHAKHFQRRRAVVTAAATAATDEYIYVCVMLDWISRALDNNKNIAEKCEKRKTKYSRHGPMCECVWHCH